MIHLNEHLRETPMFWLDPIFQETYVSPTLGDYLRNKEDIKVTKKILPPACIFYNLAIVKFPSVVFSFDEEDPDRAYISDLNDSLEVSIATGGRGLTSFDRDKLEDKIRLHKAEIFHKKGEIPRLWDFDLRGPSSKDLGKNPKKENVPYQDLKQAYQQI